MSTDSPDTIQAEEVTPHTNEKGNVPEETPKELTKEEVITKYTSELDNKIKKLQDAQQYNLQIQEDRKGISNVRKALEKFKANVFYETASYRSDEERQQVIIDTRAELDTAMKLREGFNNGNEEPAVQGILVSRIDEGIESVRRMRQHWPLEGDVVQSRIHEVKGLVSDLSSVNSEKAQEYLDQMNVKPQEAPTSSETK